MCLDTGGMLSRIDFAGGKIIQYCASSNLTVNRVLTLRSHLEYLSNQLDNSEVPGVVRVCGNATVGSANIPASWYVSRQDYSNQDRR